MQMQNLIKLYDLNIYSLLYINYTLLKNIIEKKNCYFLIFLNLVDTIIDTIETV